MHETLEVVITIDFVVIFKFFDLFDGLGTMVFRVEFELKTKVPFSEM
jgi:hypothetical protein